MTRCPNGTRKSTRKRDFGACIPKKGAVVKERVTKVSKRCPPGTRKNKKSGECVVNNKQKKVQPVVSISSNKKAEGSIRPISSLHKSSKHSVKPFAKRQSSSPESSGFYMGKVHHKSESSDSSDSFKTAPQNASDMWEWKAKTPTPSTSSAYGRFKF